MKAPVSRRVLGVADGGTLDSCIPITASIWGLLLPPLLLLPAAHTLPKNTAEVLV